MKTFHRIFLPKYVYKQKKLIFTFYIFLFAGIMMRIIFMPIGIDSDLVAHNYFSHFFSYHGVLNIYTYLSENNMCYLVYNLCYPYPPSLYFFLGTWQAIFKLIAPSFHLWMSQIGPVLEHGSPIVDYVNTATQIHWSLFLMKFPYLILDIATAFLLMRFFQDPKKSILAFQLWMINPVAIYATGIYGAWDIIPTFLFTLSLFLIYKKKLELSMIVLGVAVSFKYYPVLFIIPAVLIFSKRLKERIKLFILAFVPIIIISLPFLSSLYVKQAIFSPLLKRDIPPFLDAIMLKFFNLFGIHVNLLVIIPIFIIFYAFIYLYLYFKPYYSFQSYWKIILISLLVFYATSQFETRYLLWVIPLLVMFIAEQKKFYLFFWLFMIIGILFTSSTHVHFSWGLFTTLNTDLYNMAPLIMYVPDFLNRTLVYFVVRAIFSLITIYISYLVWRSISEYKSKAKFSFK